MADIRTWKDGEAGVPSFPSNFEVLKKAVLQVTDIKTNRNKYVVYDLAQQKLQYLVEYTG